MEQAPVAFKINWNDSMYKLRGCSVIPRHNGSFFPEFRFWPCAKLHLKQKGSHGVLLPTTSKLYFAVH